MLHIICIYKINRLGVVGLILLMTLKMMVTVNVAMKQVSTVMKNTETRT